MKPKVKKVLVKSELQIEMCFKALPIPQRKGLTVRIQKCDNHIKFLQFIDSESIRCCFVVITNQ